MKKYDLPYPKFENDNLNYYVTISDYEGKEFNIKENNLYNALSEVINYSLYFSFNEIKICFVMVPFLLVPIDFLFVIKKEGSSLFCVFQYEE